jgi:hypothetical protein
MHQFCEYWQQQQQQQRRRQQQQQQQQRQQQCVSDDVGSLQLRFRACTGQKHGNSYSAPADRTSDCNTGKPKAVC